jgi:hypothetical protein
MSPPPPRAGWASTAPPPLLDADDVQGGTGHVWTREMATGVGVQTPRPSGHPNARKPDTIYYYLPSAKYISCALISEAMPSSLNPFAIVEDK